MKRARNQSVGLFAGVGGIELGLQNAGFHSARLCEIDPHARSVLAKRFGGADLRTDIARLRVLPEIELVAAGFPCQDLSQAGRRAGIRGERFQLIDHVFRLIERSKVPPRWLLLENVPFMLRLNRGEAIQYIVERIETLGWRWAYRTVDARAFGIPQRRERVLIVASASDDPVMPLLQEDTDPYTEPPNPSGFGFYWTEGNRGLGLARDAVPPLKGGFGLGIPSAPAVWVPGEDSTTAFGTPDIRDLERLQGLPAGWTEPAEALPGGQRIRWRLVGNAVCAAVAEWVGERLLQASAEPPTRPGGDRLVDGWPAAAWGDGSGNRFMSDASSFPRQEPMTPIAEFLNHPLIPLSDRAARGFYGRAMRSTLRFPEGLREALAEYIRARDDIRSAAA